MAFRPDTSAVGVIEKGRMIVVAVFRRHLKDRSRIVKTSAMQGLTELAMYDIRLENLIRPLSSSLTLTGSPSMRSRERKLLFRLCALTWCHNATVSR